MKQDYTNDDDSFKITLLSLIHFYVSDRTEENFQKEAEEQHDRKTNQ